MAEMIISARRHGDRSPGMKSETDSSVASTEPRPQEHMVNDTRSTTRVEPKNKSPRQFTLRQALLAIGGLCVVLALYRATGLVMGTAILVVAGLVIGLIIARDSREWFTVAGAAVLLIVTVSLVAPAVSSGPASKRSVCSNNLNLIAMAIESYHQRNSCFPPAFIADKSGRPMLSWRVLLTAELNPTFYRYYRFDEPWNGPNNSKLAGRVQNLFRCPSDDGDGPKGSEHETSYLVVVGPKTAFPGDKCVALSDITDDKRNTILVVEVQNSGVHWMEPRDLHVIQMAQTINAAKGQGISSKHKGGANVAMADGTVRFLSSDELTAADVKSMLTIDDHDLKK